MKSGCSLSCSKKQDLEMDLVDWHTQLAGRDRRKAHVPMGYVPRRMSRSCSVVHDVLAGTCDDITAEVGQADRNECREPRGKAFRRLAEISYAVFCLKKKTEACNSVSLGSEPGKGYPHVQSPISP